MFLKELKEMNEKYTYAQQTIDKLQRKQGKISLHISIILIDLLISRCFFYIFHIVFVIVPFFEVKLACTKF